MKIKYIIYFLLIISVQQLTAQVNEMNISDFKLKDTSESILIDVRTPEEFSSGHLKNAQNIDYKSEDFAEKVSKLTRDKKVYVYCKAGGRSAKASKILDSLGFKDLVDLRGGFDEWEESGGEIVKE
ncbi:rhodanese-like domain-containing protein [Galbibacter mesophilus]|uniref:rhodanese-like domain-containing protein n=1 Tax=Galbibacter mesophilus TaxID=379069 RepID=UPI001F5C6223|nr:rhodanese-like domain-containing protein [Galbibacter mesophilus]MCM5661672.1 rhodanese-like domain-containing protein [Galbibacter mesophilus]